MLPERETPWSLLRALLRGATTVGGRAAELEPRLAAALAVLLEDSPASALDAATARALVIEGTGRALAAPEPPLLLVDDVQWRTPAVWTRWPSRSLAMAHPVELRLGRLDAGALCRLVDDPQLAALLAEATDGTPFAVLEVLRELEHAGLLKTEAREARGQATMSSAAPAPRRARASGEPSGPAPTDSRRRR